MPNKIIVPIAIFLIILYIYFNCTNNNKVEHYKEPIKMILLHAKWCGYCKAMLPEWNKLEQVYKNNENVQIEKYEESEHPEVIKKFNVDGFPCIYVIKDGKVNEFTENSRSFDKLDEFLKRFIV